jgi:hypothetical protein
MNKQEIKNIILEILKDDEELTLDKEKSKQIKKYNKSLLDAKKMSFKELIKDTYLDIPCVGDYDFDNFDASLKEELKKLHDEVALFISNKKKYDGYDKVFDTSSYYMYEDHAEKFDALYNLIDKFKKDLTTLLSS